MNSVDKMNNSTLLRIVTKIEKLNKFKTEIVNCKDKIDETDIKLTVDNITKKVSSLSEHGKRLFFALSDRELNSVLLTSTDRARVLTGLGITVAHSHAHDRNEMLIRDHEFIDDSDDSDEF